MVFLVDTLTLIIAGAVTFALYKIYYSIFVLGYLKRMKKAVERGNIEKVTKMKGIALRRQPKKTKRLFEKFDIPE